MTIEQRAWDALRAAIRSSEPGCLGDDRFTGSGQGNVVAAELAAICASCSVRAECRDYAVALRHRVAGFWAGRWRGSRHALADDLAV